MDKTTTLDTAKIWLENHGIKVTEERINDLSEMFLRFYELGVNSGKEE